MVEKKKLVAIQMQSINPISECAHALIRWCNYTNGNQNQFHIGKYRKNMNMMGAMPIPNERALQNMRTFKSTCRLFFASHEKWLHWLYSVQYTVYTRKSLFEFSTHHRMLAPSDRHTWPVASDHKHTAERSSVQLCTSDSDTFVCVQFVCV